LKGRFKAGRLLIFASGDWTWSIADFTGRQLGLSGWCFGSALRVWSLVSWPRRVRTRGLPIPHSTAAFRRY